MSQQILEMLWRSPDCPFVYVFIALPTPPPPKWDGTHCTGTRSPSNSHCSVWGGGGGKGGNRGVAEAWSWQCCGTRMLWWLASGAVGW